MFSERDAKEFTLSFFQDFLDKMDQEKYEPKPFALKVDSNLRILGFLNGQYFVTQHEEAEAYKKDYDRVLDLIKVDK